MNSESISTMPQKSKDRHQYPNKENVQLRGSHDKGANIKVVSIRDPLKDLSKNVEKNSIKQPLRLVKESYSASDKLPKPSSTTTEDSKSSAVPERYLTVIKEKTSLKRGGSFGHAYLESNHAIFYDSLYNKEYFDENYNYMLQAENWCIFQKVYLDKYSDFDYRLTFVNWLVYVQRLTNVSDITIFMTVRMFDHLLISAKVYPEKYLLFGLTCLWINNKLHDVKTIQLSKLFKLTCGKFTKHHLLTAEAETLKLLHFKINYSEPSTFLYYYIDYLNLQDRAPIYYAAMFVLDMFMLLLEFSSTAPSVLAVVALLTAMEKVKIDSSSFLKFIYSHLTGQGLLERFRHKMMDRFNAVLHRKNLCNEIITKYSVQERLYVTKYFL